MFKKICSIIFTFLFILIFGCQTNSTDKQKEISVQVIIYGGTSAAVTTAVQLARMDKEVVIVCSDKHLGGLSASGLGYTDTGNKSVIGGLSREFYQRVYNEKWNGIQVGVLHHSHHFGDMKISPYYIPGDPPSGVLPCISTEDPGEKGEGDKRTRYNKVY